jgi:hypothetical protein
VIYVRLAHAELRECAMRAAACVSEGFMGALRRRDEDHG